MSLKKENIWIGLIGLFVIFLLMAKAIRIDKGVQLTATIEQKTAVPGGAGNVLVLICDLDGKLVRVTHNWDENDVIGSEIKLRRLDKLLFSPVYEVVE